MHGTRGAAATLHAREDLIGDLQTGAACPLWATFASCPTGPKLDLRRTAGLHEKRPPPRRRVLSATV